MGYQSRLRAAGNLLLDHARAPFLARDLGEVIFPNTEIFPYDFGICAYINLFIAEGVQHCLYTLFQDTTGLQVRDSLFGFLHV